MPGTESLEGNNIVLIAIELITVIVLMMLGVVFRNRSNTPPPAPNVDRSLCSNSGRWACYALAFLFAAVSIVIGNADPSISIVAILLGSSVVPLLAGAHFVWLSCFFIEIHEKEILVRTIFGSRSVAFSDIKRVYVHHPSGRGRNADFFTNAYDDGGTRLLRIPCDIEDYDSVYAQFMARLEDGVVVEKPGAFLGGLRRSSTVFRRSETSSTPEKKSSTPEVELHPTHEHFYDR